MQPRARIALVALLVAGAIVAVRVPVADSAGPPNRAEPGDPDEAFAWLMLLVVPAVAVIVVALLRYIPARRPSHDGPLGHPPLKWRPAAAALVVLVLLAAGLGLLGQLIETPAPPRAGVRQPPAPDGGRRTDGTDGGRRTDGTDGTAVAGDGLNLELWSVVLAGLLVAVLVAVSVARRRQPATPVPGNAPESASVQPALITAAIRGRAAVDDPVDDARTAIIRCYAAMEQALAEEPSTAPRPADTPSEVLLRAVETGQLRDESGGHLVDLFARARYSSQTMSERDRSSASSALTAILRQLREPTWTRS
ncbi:MAG: DUF4129 domain-containing protein [Thermocrispum sp.]